ncbi:hypothetical protein [Rhodococcus sp. NPDC058514]|uniref:hypothetical protein n=1 Tax=unclassified Rhodococcus (in: high G+C Gram-positive bacteria) TaxID=192944 RepID=UPI003663DAA1
MIVLGVNGALLATGFLTRAQAVLLFAVVEVPLACVVGVALATGVVAQRRRGLGIRQSVSRVLGVSPFWPLVRAEIRAYRSLWLWTRGRYLGIEPGALVFTASRGTLVVPAAFAIATVIEIGVLHLLLPWWWLRIVVAGLSVWSLVALLGYLAVHRVHPHYLTERQFVVRQSGAVVAIVDRADIVSVALCRRYAETAPTVIDGRLYLPNADGTTVDIVLASPVTAQLPALLASRRKVHVVDRISVYVDEPTQLVSALSELPSTVARTASTEDMPEAR